jgi:hypothetical protein
MPTHRRLRELQRRCEFSDGEFLAFEKPQHARTLRISERREYRKDRVFSGQECSVEFPLQPRPHSRRSTVRVVSSAQRSITVQVADQSSALQRGRIPRVSRQQPATSD